MMDENHLNKKRPGRVKYDQVEKAEKSILKKHLRTGQNHDGGKITIKE